MLSLDDRPDPPELPQFSRDLEEYLAAAARSGSARSATRQARRRKYALGGLAAAGVLAVAVAGLEAGSGGPPASGPGPGASPSGVPTQLAAFSVVTNPGGKVTLTLTQGQMFDPAALREALARAGVPALVTVGSVCTWPGPSDALPQVLSGPIRQPGGSTRTTITPSAIPAGQELSIGYFAVPGGGGVHISLVPEHKPLTCGATPPAPPGRGVGPR